MLQKRICSSCGTSRSSEFLRFRSELNCQPCGIKRITRHITTLCTSSPEVLRVASTVQSFEELPHLFRLAENHLTRHTLFGRFIAWELQEYRERIQRYVASNSAR